MLRVISLVLSLVAAAMLSSCRSNVENDENGQQYFNAKVLEIHEEYVLAECLEITSGTVKTSDKVIVSTDVVSAGGVPEMHVGECIRVVHGSEVEISYPARLGTVFAIYPIDDEGKIVEKARWYANYEKPLSKSPPELVVRNKENEVKATLGTFTWTSDNGDGTSQIICADSMHPLQCKDFMTLLECESSDSLLVFDNSPDSVKVRCWSDEDWNNMYAEDEDVDVKDFVIMLKQGSYIYEVLAEWEEENGFGGTAHYAFYAKV